MIRKNTVLFSIALACHTLTAQVPDVTAFLKQYPLFETYSDELAALYQGREDFIWFDATGPVEFADVLENSLNHLAYEGVSAPIPYEDKIHGLLKNPSRSEENELLLSAAYLFYHRNVYQGLRPEASTSTGWQLPREKRDYIAWLETELSGRAMHWEEKGLFRQYYALRTALSRYRTIEADGGWPEIALPDATAIVRPGDAAAVIGAVRTRLFREHFLPEDTKSSFYDAGLRAAVMDYRDHAGLEASDAVDRTLIQNLNIPVAERIRTIVVNMERCRWIPAAANSAGHYIAVNIPSYSLTYVRDGQTVLTSDVIVGKELTKTVVFSGDVSSIVLSPYWNIPKSILDNEIRPALKKDPSFLAKHEMEWSGAALRQKPGPKNPLGTVKFLFPNSNSIYLHDTPSKALFGKHRRAFSHGCIRVEKARELAVILIGQDGGWTRAKTESAMGLTHPTVYDLKKTIPVYIAYFTAWADEKGGIRFFDDVYGRDQKLAELLFCE